MDCGPTTGSLGLYAFKKLICGQAWIFAAIGQTWLKAALIRLVRLIVFLWFIPDVLVKKYEKRYRSLRDQGP
jgi:hypothetical protein